MRRAGVAAVLMLLSACGAVSGPVIVPSDEIPYPLSRATPAQTGSVRTEVLYFERASRVLPVVRRVQEALTQEESTIRALIAGPSRDERSHGVTTAIPSSTRLLGVTVGDGIATVNVSEEFQEPNPPERIQVRIAQIVYTLTRLASINALLFQVDGQPIDIVTNSGGPVSRPVTRADFALQAPAP